MLRKIVLVLFWFVYFILPLPAQSLDDFQTSGKKKDVQVAGKNKGRPATKRTVGADNVSVSFVSDVDCALYIKNMPKQTLLAGVSKQVLLLPGTYFYQSVSITSGDLLEDSLVVIAKQPQVRHIPLKAVIKKRIDASAPPPQVKVDAPGEAVKDDGSNAAAVVKEIMNNLVRIEGGEFMMGSNVGAGDAKPEHPVKIKPFYLGKYEVTQRQWQALVGSNPSRNANCPDCPVETVTSDEVQLFLNKVNSLSKRRVRLPTEAEWEYAARKGGMPENLKTAVWYQGNAGKSTRPVGQLAPNALGVHDLFGNVAEWCSDWYDAGFYKSSAGENPMGPLSGVDKVVRGGSFADNEKKFGPGMRNRYSWFGKNPAIGFRVVVD